MSSPTPSLPRRHDGRPTVSVVIPARNEAHVIERCLGALLTGCVEPADEIIVVDNGSDDGTAEIAARHPRTRVIREPRPGVTYARTAGFDGAGGDVIARIDADSIVCPEWADRIRETFASDASLDGIAGGAGIAELSPAGRFWFGWWYRGFRLWHERSIGVEPMLYGFNSALRASAWRAARHLVALGDDAVSEDVDVTIALLRTGHVLRFEPELRVKARLFRSIDRDKLARYYRTDSLTLTRHRFGNPRRWVDDASDVGAPGYARG